MDGRSLLKELFATPKSKTLRLYTNSNLTYHSTTMGDLFEKDFFKTAEQEIDFAMCEGVTADYDINISVDGDAGEKWAEELSRACSQPSLEAESDVLPRQDLKTEKKPYPGSAMARAGPPAATEDLSKPRKFCLHGACTRYKQTGCRGYCFRHAKLHIGFSVSAKFRLARKCKHGSCAKYRQKGGFCHAHAKLYKYTAASAGPPIASAGAAATRSQSGHGEDPVDGTQMSKASKVATNSTIAKMVASARKDPTLWKSPLFAMTMAAVAKQTQAKPEAVAGLSTNEPRPRGRKRDPSWEHARAQYEPEVAVRARDTPVAIANTETVTAGMVEEGTRSLVCGGGHLVERAVTPSASGIAIDVTRAASRGKDSSGHYSIIEEGLPGAHLATLTSPPMTDDLEPLPLDEWENGLRLDLCDPLLDIFPPRCAAAATSALREMEEELWPPSLPTSEFAPIPTVCALAQDPLPPHQASPRLIQSKPFVKGIGKGVGEHRPMSPFLYHHW